MKKPNIIFIMADQLAAKFIGCYGSEVDSTPTLDLLAEQGTRFDRCYTTSPVCAPNRASILTGRSPVIHGIVTNNLHLTTDNPTYPQVLKSVGYRTGGFGKFHHTCMGQPHPADFRYLGFDETMISEDPKWGDYIEWVKKKHPQHYQAALAMCWDQPFIDEKLRKENAEAIEKHLKVRRKESDWGLMYSSPIPQEVHQTTFITDHAIDFIARHCENAADQPFMCHVSYVDPHDPYDPPAPYDTMYSADQMPDPIPPSWTERGNAVLKQSQDFCGFDTIAENIPAQKKLRALYHGSIRFLDDQISRIIDAVEQQGIADETIIVFTTDHGDMMGDHALITKGVKFFDKGIRCPLIVHGKGIRSGSNDRLACSLDFFPFFCDLAQIADEERPPLEGKSFLSECCGSSSTAQWPEVTIEAPYQESERSVRAIITDDNWRFTIFDIPDTGEMFDLNIDPDEQHNLFYDPQYTEKKLALYERLTRAFMRSHQVYQYRNLPLKDGRKCMLAEGFKLRDNVFQIDKRQRNN